MGAQDRVDGEVLNGEHSGRRVLHSVYALAGLDVPHDNLLVCATAQEQLAAGEAGANDRLDKVGVPGVPAPRLARLDVPRPYVLVPRAGKDCAVSTAPYGKARNGGLWASVCGLGLSRLLFAATVREDPELLNARAALTHVKLHAPHMTGRFRDEYG